MENASINPSRPKARGRLLLVEDEADAARVLARALQFEWDVIVASDGVEGLAAALQAPHPDVILTDMSMPRLSGVEMVRRLRAAMPLHRIPVIFLTAQGGALATAAALQTGARCFVSKPVNLPALEEKLRRALATPSYPPRPSQPAARRP